MDTLQFQSALAARIGHLYGWTLLVESTTLGLVQESDVPSSHSFRGILKFPRGSRQLCVSDVVLVHPRGDSQSSVLSLSTKERS
mmetsp:Transcript_902/g.2569  ORF Transcript_902/g.2569 Transcript_902/m.2569 type:complete len:84 (+) Transcript_902:86-337(+)